MLAPVSRFFVIQESEYAGSHTADSPKQGSPGPQALRVHNWLERCTQDASNDDPAGNPVTTVALLADDFRAPGSRKLAATPVSDRRKS